MVAWMILTVRCEVRFQYQQSTLDAIILFSFMYLPHTRGPYHKDNRITQEHKMVSHSA